MGRVVELPVDRIVWPERCCCCAGKDFTWRTHTEKVVVWTVLSITKYREISLKIPVCGACAGRSMLWFGGAAAAGALGYALVALPANAGSAATSATLVLWIGAIVAAMMGVRAKPLKILGYDADKETLRIQVRDERISGALLRQVGSKVSKK
jgi:hypothetical protein